MTPRPDVAELLHAGYGDRTIARQLGVTASSVTTARAELGLPKVQGGHKPAANVEDLFWRRTQPTEDGHLNWDGHRTNKGTPAIRWNGALHSALRVAYLIRTGHDPEGYAHVTCEHPGCVAPQHVDDTAVTPRRAHHKTAAGRQPNGSNEEVTVLLQAGLSDKQIARQLHTNPKRIARQRAGLGLPPFENRRISFEERWAANTELVDGGHIRWTGRLRDGSTPAVLHEGRDASPRRIAFERLHGRPAVGRVLPGCGFGPCVQPAHLEDQPMRERLDTQFAAIFKEAS
jgi:DNA-binding CsgD family transcriptional regulator